MTMTYCKGCHIHSHSHSHGHIHSHGHNHSHGHCHSHSHSDSFSSTHSRHGPAARLAAPPESNTPTSRRKATGRPVPSASDSQRTQPWSPGGVFYPWLQARCACNRIPRHAGQGIVGTGSFPTHAPMRRSMCGPFRSVKGDNIRMWVVGVRQTTRGVAST